MSDSTFGQVYLRVHDDEVAKGESGYAYYQVIGKGSRGSSFYSAMPYELSERYTIARHFPKGSLTRAVESPIDTKSLELFKEVKGLKKGDTMILRDYHDSLRIDAFEATISSVTVKTAKNDMGLKNTITTVKFADNKKKLSTFAQTAQERYNQHIIKKNVC